MKKKIIILVVMALMVSIFAVPAYGCGCSRGLTQGAYKTVDKGAGDWGATDPGSAFPYFDAAVAPSGVGSWLDVLWTAPRGDAWYILAHQYIAAYLNGYDDSAAMPEAVDLLEKGPGLKGADRAAAIALAQFFDTNVNGIAEE
ncbi:MAG: hypothetical protein ABRQ23_01560 [Syntrophomonadaceae bacterium]